MVEGKYETNLEPDKGMSEREVELVWWRLF